MHRIIARSGTRCAGPALVGALALWVHSALPVHADVRALIGQPAPAIHARPLSSDETVALEEYRGRVVLLTFVATWCGACRHMAPELEAIERVHPELQILALSHEARDRLRAHAAQEPRTYPTLQCSGATARRYHATGLPTLVLVDRAGVVRAAYQGATQDVIHRLRRDVAALVTAP